MNGTEPNEKGLGNQAGQEQEEFEAVLTKALRRVDAPEGFAARMAAMAEAEERSAGIRRAAAQQQARWWQFGLGWKPAWGGLAAVLVAGVLGGHVVHEHHVEAEARMHASREFDVSLQITDKAMDHAREQLQRAGVKLDGEQ